MAVEGIIARILHDAELEAGRITADAAAEAGRMLATAVAASRREAKAIGAEAAHDAELAANRIISAANRKAKQGRLLARESAINETLGKAAELLEGAKGAEYRDFLTRMVKDGTQAIGEDALLHVCREEDRDYLEKAGFSVSDVRIKGLGGVVARSPDGRISIDNTFEGVMARRGEELRIRAANRLFSEE